MPGTEVYGQHEISELTKSPEKLTHLLDRFIVPQPAAVSKKGELRRELRRNRSRIVEVQRELATIDERLAALPGLEEKLARFQEAGVEEQLHDRSLLVTEERVLKTAGERVDPFDTLLADLRKRLPVDLGFLSADSLRDLPAASTLAGIVPVLERLGTDLYAAAAAIEEALARARAGIGAVATVWGQRRDQVQTAYETTLGKLQETKIEGAQFIDLRTQVEELRPLTERKEELDRENRELGTKRRELLTSWEDAKTADFRRLDRAATKVSKKLAGRVRVRVAHAGNRQPLADLLKRKVKGRLSDRALPAAPQVHGERPTLDEQRRRRSDSRCHRDPGIRHCSSDLRTCRAGQDHLGVAGARLSNWTSECSHQGRQTASPVCVGYIYVSFTPIDRG